MGSGESHFNVSLVARDKATRQCPQTTTFEEKGEPNRIRTEVPLLNSLSAYRQAKPAHWHKGGVGGRDDDDELMLNVLRCHLTY